MPEGPGAGHEDPPEGSREAQRDAVPDRRPDPLPGTPRREEVRRRLRGLLVRPGRGQVAAAVLLGVLGFGVTTQVRANETNDAYAGLRSADLVQVLNGLNAESRRAETELNELRATRSRLTDRSQSREAALAQVRDQASTLGILAGTLPTQGPGVRITITDPEGKVSLNTLLDGIEELRAGGAEAMEVNDTVRVVAQTSFDTDDGTLLVDGQRVAPPYVLDVIGNPPTLAKVLDIAGGFRYDVESSDGTVEVQRRDRVKIASVTSGDDPRFAQPAG
ncbi:membrane protein [Marmoricola endophyticus]|uniref:Membrane protein n=1 Tax=Marmoricola endophyticus TaxID=2040280 RepID=A0A917EZD3_9ACTN|nr:DUF881 domain-containing protein [Marmoricola endophyticus]GGF34854.1 membrane protein [Marmoricola endophyticus]